MTYIQDNNLINPATNDEVIDFILALGEEVSDVKLWPYQRDFARAIVRSVVEEDAKTITALFARQCLHPDSNILTPSGYVPLKNLKKGDRVLSVMNGTVTEDAISHMWKSSGTARTYTLSKSKARSFTVLDGHRIYDALKDQWFVPGMQESAEAKKVHTREIYLPICDQPPYFQEYEIPEFTKQEAALTALSLCFARDSEHSLLDRMFGQTCKAEYRFMDSAEKVAKEIGLPQEAVSKTSMYSAFTFDPVGDINWLGLLCYRETALRVIFQDAEFSPGRKDKTWVLSLPLKSNGKYLETLFRLLEISGITYDFDDKKKIISVKDNFSLISLLHVVKDKMFYAKVYSMLWFDSENKKSSLMFNTVQLFPLLQEKYPKLAKRTRTGRTRSAYAYQFSGKSNIPFSSAFQLYRDFVQIYGYKAWCELPLKFGYRRITNYSPPVQRDNFIDFETEYTGNYFADNVLMHNCGKSESLKVSVLGLILTLPGLAHRYPADQRWQKYKNGFWVGIFAPSLLQSKNPYNRVRNTLQSPRGKQFLERLGIDTNWPKNTDRELILTNGSRVYNGPASPDANIESQTFHLILGDEAQDIDAFKWDKSIVPMATYTGGTKVMVGTANTVKSRFHSQIEQNREHDKDPNNFPYVQLHFEVDWRTPASLMKNYHKSVMEEIARVTVDADSFKMAYCNQFIFARGMAIDPELLEYKSNKHPRGVLYHYDAVDHYAGDKHVVVGIDIGQKHDPTVCIAVEIDPNAPIEVLNFRTFNKRVIGMLEIKGDDIDLQTPQILDFLRRMRAQTVIVDSTGVGDPYYARLSKAEPGINWIRFVFSQRSKSDLYKAFLADMATGRVMLPGGEKTSQTREFYELLKELSELEKAYNGQYLNCKAPERRGCHDDYPVALALACYACKDYYVGNIEQSRNIFMRRTGSRRGLRVSKRR